MNTETETKKISIGKNFKCKKCGKDNLICKLVWTHNEYYTTNKYLMECPECGEKAWYRDKLIED